MGEIKCWIYGIRLGSVYFVLYGFSWRERLPYSVGSGYRPAGYFQDFEIGGYYVVACVASIYKVFVWWHCGISKHSFVDWENSCVSKVELLYVVISWKKKMPYCEM